MGNEANVFSFFVVVIGSTINSKMIENVGSYRAYSITEGFIAVSDLLNISTSLPTLTPNVSS